MNQRIPLRAVALVGLLGAWAATAVGQEPAPTPASFARMIDIDALIDNHSRFLARKYNLTEEQDRYTQDFLRSKADEFLSKHREELYAIADRLFEVRGGGEMTQEELIAWGQRAQPLFDEAKTLIVQGNDDWRQILTEDQRRIHDEDVKQMYESFTQTQEQLQRIVAGQMTIDEFRKGPRGFGPSRPANPTPRITPTPAPVTATPSTTPGAPSPGANDNQLARGRSPRPQPGATSAPVATPRGAVRPGAHGAGTPAVNSENFESEWERYTREFITRYQLDDPQKQRAEQILKDCQQQAQNYTARRKAELERLDKQLAEATEENKAKVSSEVAEQRKKIMDPVNQIFEKRLKPRLEKLPTRAQREAVESGANKAPAAPPVKPTPAQPPPNPQK